MVSFATWQDSPVPSAPNVQQDDGQPEMSDGQGGEAVQSDCDIKPDNSALLSAVQPDERYQLNNGTSRLGCSAVTQPTVRLVTAVAGPGSRLGQVDRTCTVRGATPYFLSNNFLDLHRRAGVHA